MSRQDLDGADAQPAGGPSDLSPQAVSAKGAHRAYDKERYREVAEKLAAVPVHDMAVGRKPYIVLHALDRDALVDLLLRADEVLRRLRELLTAVCYADPPKLFNGIECHEARVPIEFVADAKAAISKATGEA